MRRVLRAKKRWEKFVPECIYPYHPLTSCSPFSRQRSWLPFDWNSTNRKRLHYYRRLRGKDVSWLAWKSTVALRPILCLPPAPAKQITRTEPTRPCLHPAKTNVGALTHFEAHSRYGYNLTRIQSKLSPTALPFWVQINSNSN